VHHVEAMVNGAWTTIASGTFVGHRKLHRMTANVTASKIRPGHHRGARRPRRRRVRRLPVAVSVMPRRPHANVRRTAFDILARLN